MTALIFSLPLSIGIISFLIIAVAIHEMVNPPAKVAAIDEAEPSIAPRPLSKKSARDNRDSSLAA